MVGSRAEKRASEWTTPFSARFFFCQNGLASIRVSTGDAVVGASETGSGHWDEREVVNDGRCHNSQTGSVTMIKLIAPVVDEEQPKKQRPEMRLNRVPASASEMVTLVETGEQPLQLLCTVLP